MTTGSIRSPLGSWIGGLSAPHHVNQAGFRSMAAFWMGGVCSISTSPPSVVLLGGGPGYGHHHDNRRQEELATRVSQRRIELRQIDDQISKSEVKRIAAHNRQKSKLIAQQAAARLAKQEQTLLEEINVLRIERERLMRFIDDEEAILILLLSLPFH